jgi:hypothetical protein
MARNAGRRARGPRRIAPWLCACTALLAVSPRAGATRTKLQATGETSLGVTDNAQSAPDVPLPGGASKSAGVFLVLRPGVSLGVLSARTVNRLTYTFDYNLFLTRNATSSSSNRLEYRGFFDLDPRVNAILGASATEADSYAALTLAPPASGLLPLLPSGTSQLFTATADELVNFELGVGWRAWESIGVVFGTPLFDTVAPRTVAPNARLGLEYAWTGDAVGIEGRANYAVVHDGVRLDGTVVPLDRELTVGGVGRYRHDIGRYFTSGAEAGAVRVTRFSTDASHWYPIGGANLAYADVGFDSQLTYSHLVTTNVLLGQSLLADEVRLRGAVPLDKKGILSIAASGGYQIGRLLDETASTAANVSVLNVDVTFGWQLNPWLLVGARAQHIDQRSDVRVPTLPVSFSQNSVMLGASVHFPPDLEMPAAYRAPRRVDQTDELRGVGARDGEQIPAPTGRAR